MKKIFTALLLIIIVLFALSSISDAKTKRSASAKREFRQEMPCPSTGFNSGACPGYEIDHIKPLKDNGADHKNNLQWLTIKEHKEKTKKERYEKIDEWIIE